MRSGTVEDVAILLGYAHSVLVVPGYGLAVAQGQHAARELAQVLEQRGITVLYAIHPVAGRMPGHMNVLLAEADVPYEHKRCMAAYMTRAMGFYQFRHIERGMGMIFKSVGLKPRGVLSDKGAKLAWRLLQWRRRKLAVVPGARTPANDVAPEQRAAA